MSNFPHSVKVDRNIKNDYNKNYDLNTMNTLREVDEYACVMENAGEEIPEIALGLKYRFATSKKDRKLECENRYIDPNGSSEATLYLRKDDWIRNEEEYHCGVFNSKDDERVLYKVDNNPRKFISKKLCDKYKNKGEYDIYTKMTRNEPERNVLDLRSSEDSALIKQTKIRIVLITVSIISFFLLYWTVFYGTKKPYDFFDFLSYKVIYKSLIIILIFGCILYLWCPFDTCYNKKDIPSYRKNLPLTLKKDFCNYLNDSVSELEYPILKKFDNSPFYKFLTPIINTLFSTNSLLSSTFNKTYLSMCVPCKLEYECLERNNKYDIKIISPPSLIEEFENNLRAVANKNSTYKMSSQDYLNAINTKYNTNSSGKPFDTGSIIILRTNDNLDENSNLVFMASVVMSPTGYDYKWIIPQKRSNKMEDTLINEVVNMKYNGNLAKLKVKKCKVSHRILSIDNNYELLGYNFPLDVNTFNAMFENNEYSYRRFFFFPRFNLKELNSSLNTYPSFKRRKLISIYKYLVQNPVKKFICPNVSVVYGEYNKYEISDTTYKIRLEETDKLIEELKDINDYHNDDENDNDYMDISYYDDLLKLNYIERSEYRESLINTKLKEYNSLPIIERKTISNINEEYIVKRHDLVPYKYENNGIFYKCTICKQSCFVEN